jgi:hypothetical protein
VDCLARRRLCLGAAGVRVRIKGVVDLDGTVIETA